MPLICPTVQRKVDELMAICDALEQGSTDSLLIRQALVDSLLTTLLNSADATELAFNWKTLETHFVTLFRTTNSIDSIKRTIMNLAIRGRLVEQIQTEENASALYAKISESRRALVVTGRAKRLKNEAAILEKEKDFCIPDGGEWAAPQSYVGSDWAAPHRQISGELQGRPL